MPGHCFDCGRSVPNGQRTCSMCYGDPFHGRDGYYLMMLEEDLRAEMERKQQWESDERELRFQDEMMPPSRFEGY